MPRGDWCRLLLSLSLGWLALSGAAPVRADGSFPDARQVLLPPERPNQIILATNFGLIYSEDRGATWLFSCEQSQNAYAGPYRLAAPPSSRLFALSGSGLTYSDDDSCSWEVAGGSLTDVLPYGLAVDPSDSERLYVIGAPRGSLQSGESIFVSDDGGVTFGDAAFTAPERSALVGILAPPSLPGTLFAAMFSSPENHPILLRSDDRGQSWEVVADLADSLGESPFELVALDVDDPQKMFARVLGASTESLAISYDGGLTFVPAVTIAGELKSFLQLASGTLLVGGTAGTAAVAYRSSDGGRTFEAWSGAPRIHAMAERAGKLYVAADNFLDGYAIGQSDDEGLNIEPLGGFEDVRAVKTCVSRVCAKSCEYQAGINLWPQAVCGDPPSDDEPSGGAGGTEASGAPNTGAGAAPVDPAPADGTGGEKAEEPLPRRQARGGGCACEWVDAGPSRGWSSLLALGLMGACCRMWSRTRARSLHPRRHGPSPRNTTLAQR